MKLQFIGNKSASKNTVLFSAIGYLLFRKNAVSSYNIKDGQKYVIAHDTKPHDIPVLYIFADEDVGEFEVRQRKSSYSIYAKNVAKELGIDLPMECRIEDWSDNVDFPDGSNKIVHGFKLCF